MPVVAGMVRVFRLYHLIWPPLGDVSNKPCALSQEEESVAGRGRQSGIYTVRRLCISTLHVSLENSGAAAR